MNLYQAVCVCGYARGRARVRYGVRCDRADRRVGTHTSHRSTLQRWLWLREMNFQSSALCINVCVCVVRDLTWLNSRFTSLAGVGRPRLQRDVRSFSLDPAMPTVPFPPSSFRARVLGLTSTFSCERLGAREQVPREPSVHPPE
jgi:hypothetical protein